MAEDAAEALAEGGAGAASCAAGAAEDLELEEGEEEEEEEEGRSGCGESSESAWFHGREVHQVMFLAAATGATAPATPAATGPLASRTSRRLLTAR